MASSSVNSQQCGCRQFAAVPEPDAQLGLVAVQLGEAEEAKKLFSSAGRPDLLNKLLQASPTTFYTNFGAVLLCLLALFRLAVWQVLHRFP